MEIFYPRKQTAIIFVICAATVFGAAYSVKSGAQPSSNRQIPDAVSVTSPASNDTATAVSANEDWKKQFLDNNSGTNGKGTTKQAKAADNKPLTSTDLLGRDMMARYVDLQQANLLSDKTVVDQTAQDLIISHVKTDAEKIYTENDIALTADVGASSLTDFSRAVTAAIDAYKVKQTESQVVSAYLTNSDPSVLSGLDPIISSYKRLLASLLVIPVPQTMKSNQLALINSISALESAAETLRATDIDPVQGLGGVSVHMDGLQQLTQALTDIHEALAAANISFNLDSDTLNMLFS